MSNTRRLPKRDKNHLEGLRGGAYTRVSVAKDIDPETGKVVTDERGASRDKSTDDQETDGRTFAARRKLGSLVVYSDPDRSASRFATKNRPEFERMLADVAAGKLDILWFWELSRSARNLSVFLQLRDLCRDYGVLIAVGDQVYDPAEYVDMLGPIIMGLVAEGESETRSKSTRRGQHSNAAAGLPPGAEVYGYRRIYTAGPRNRRLSQALARQEPDELLPGAVLADGQAPDRSQLVKDSPAWIVQEMFSRFAAGWGYGRIAADLNRRGIPVARKPWHSSAKANPRWHATTIRIRLQNPHYIGQRTYQGQVLEGVKAVWPPLVDDATYWSVQRRFADPDRKRWRERFRVDTTPIHLLSGIVLCGKCGLPMYQRVFARDKRRGKAAAPVYACMQSGCQAIAVNQEVLDEYVEDKIILWGSDPAVFAELAKVSDSAAAAAAQADVDRLETELEELRQLAESGEMSAVLAARAEKGLLGRLDDARQRARDAVMPKVLADNIGPQFAHRWVNVLDIPAKKQILRYVAEIRVNRVGSGRYHRPVSERVEWRWLLGPDA